MWGVPFSLLVSGYDDILSVQLTWNKTLSIGQVWSLEQGVMSGEVEKCPILHVCPKFDVFTLTDGFQCTNKMH